MKRYIINCIVFSVLTLCSCENYFELERPVQFPWQNVSELELTVREAYRQFSNDPWANPLGTLTLVHFGQSDIVQLWPEMSLGGNYSMEYYNRTYATTEPCQELATINDGGAFKFLYYIITNNNAALQFINDAEAKGADLFSEMKEADKELLKRFKGELYFTRGVAYWYLARIYAPPFDPNGNNDSRHFVLRTDFINKAENLRNPELGTVAEVWKQIQDDLEEAKQLLPESYGQREPQERGRANKFAASGMLMRVYFMTGQHAKAQTECDFILDSNNGLYDLSEEPLVAFNRVGNESAREIIWETAYYNGSTRFDRIPGIFGHNIYNNQNRHADYAAYTLAYSTLKKIGWMADGQNGDYTEIPEARDDKRYTQLYKRYEQSGVTGGDVVNSSKPQVWIHKYFRSTVSGRHSNRPMIRLAEVYLTRSILRFKGGNTSGALSDLNVIRNRAGLGDFSGTLTTEVIHNERIKELACEHGDRVYYLIGLREPIGIGDRDPARFSPIMPPYADYFWKVPLIERQQNEAYH